MPSRKQLELRARVVGLDPSTYANDSKLEQRVAYLEYNLATVAGTLASGTLTSDATNNADADTITVGSVVYTYKTTLTEAVATNTLTSNNVNVSNLDTVNVNGRVYTFKTTIVSPYDVNIGASADASLTNLVSAITLAGTIGTDYGTGTVVHPNVTAAAVSSHATVLSAKTVGVNGNQFYLQTGAATLTTTADFFSGGVDPLANQIKIGGTASISLDNTKSAINGTAGAGTTYSSNTVAHPLVAAGTKTATTLAVAATAASAGLTIATTGSTGAAHLSWGAATLTGNVQPVIAKSAYSSTGTNGLPV